MWDKMDRIFADLERLEREQEIADGVKKAFNDEAIIAIKALFKAIGLTYRSALDEGLSESTAERMAYAMFEKTLNGGASL